MSKSGDRFGENVGYYSSIILCQKHLIQNVINPAGIIFFQIETSIYHISCSAVHVLIWVLNLKKCKASILIFFLLNLVCPHTVC